MSETAKGLIVHLEPGWRVGEKKVGADRLVKAIECIKGVTKVEILTEDFDHRLAVEQARWQLEEKLWKALKDD